MKVEPKGESPLRCAYCHGDLGPEPWSCPECRTLLHADCWQNSRTCPTLGCPTCHIAKATRRPAPRRWTRFVLPALMSGICCFLSPCGQLTRIEIHKYQVEHCHDPAAVLAACRKLMRETKTTDPMGEDYRDERIAELPSVIRDLEPRHVSVGRDRVSIGYGGGFIYWWGLTAVSVEKASAPQLGRKVIDGLWFYDSGNPPR